MKYKGKHFKNDTKTNKALKILIIIICVGLICAIGFGVKTIVDRHNQIEVFTIDLGGKEPQEFTWEDYQELTPDEKQTFPDYFESYDAYQRWYDSVAEN